jgi:glycosyltransferase involved in cell wall biosynthesis
MKLTTVILTRNELANIKQCMESASSLPGEVLLIDESDDGTDDLAKSLGARVVRKGFSEMSDLRNFAIDIALGDYVFFLDADERVSPKLAAEINGFLESGAKEACAMRRHNIAFGKRVRFGPLYPDWVTRLFPRTEVQWSGMVHERSITGLSIKKFKGPLWHFTYNNFTIYIKKQERYAELWATQAYKEGRTATTWSALYHAFFNFLKMFFLKLGFLGGPVTWALSWYYSTAYTLGKYLLLADKQKKPRAEDDPPQKETY